MIYKLLFLAESDIRESMHGTVSPILPLLVPLSYPTQSPS